MQKNGEQSPTSSVSILREKKRTEASFQFHREYIRKRLKEAALESVSIKELFEEIKAKGYRGTLRTVQTFVSIIRSTNSPEVSLQFHKEYIRKRLTAAASESVSTKELFEEIKAKGYRGTLRTMQIFVSMLRTSSKPIEASLRFHEEYIRKKLKEAGSESVSIRQLFEEIQASGYLGSYDTVRAFVSTIREKKHKRGKASLEFHKKYITKRLTEAVSESVSIRKLFEEIRASGYLGSYDTVRAFVSTFREKRPKTGEASLEFYKEYIRKRVEKAGSESISTKRLFKEMKANGYLGAHSTLAGFVSRVRVRLPEASLGFHKEYIRKRLGEAAPESISTKQIFKEIKANGYLGAYNTLTKFVSTIRKIWAE